MVNRYPALLLAVFCFFTCGTLAANEGDSILFRAEERSIPSLKREDGVKIRLLLSYRGEVATEWRFLMATLNYRDPDLVLSGPPEVRLSGAFAQETVRGLVNVNEQTGRIELIGSSFQDILKTEPGVEAEFAEVSFPIKPRASGTVTLQFVPDSVAKDGNLVAGAQKRRSIARVMDGYLTVEPLSLFERFWLPSLFGALLAVLAVWLVREKRVPFLRSFWSVIAALGQRGMRTALGVFAIVAVSVIIIAWFGQDDSSEPSSKTQAELREALYSQPSGYQFEWEEIRVPAAYKWEGRLARRSVSKAVEYLEIGRKSWERQYQCVGCHVSGVYMLTRPELISLGPPEEDARQFLLRSLKPYTGDSLSESLETGHRTAQVVYSAAGLASWDAHVSRSLSPETVRMLDLMFELQGESGEWQVPGCWPPLQSSPFQLSTVAAIAAGTAPGWLAGLKDQTVLARVERMKSRLKSVDPPHDYARVWLLWADTKMPGLLETERREEYVEMILSRQAADGGWSLRAFALPSEWGDGSREEKISSDPEFYLASSDGHMTGLAISVLRDAGIPVLDPRIQNGVQWIEKNQRMSGRWWTRSLNNEGLHLITYSGTCFSLLALWKCGMLTLPNP